MPREVGPLREILSQQPIGVFIGSALPRTARLAEVDLKGSFTNNMTTSAWPYGVVPLAMKRIEFELDLGEIGVADDQALGVRVGVDLRAHLQSAARLGVGYQLDDHLVTDQWATTPVHRDEREQAVLDLVPLAGARQEPNDFRKLIHGTVIARRD